MDAITAPDTRPTGLSTTTGVRRPLGSPNAGSARTLETNVTRGSALRSGVICGADRNGQGSRCGRCGDAARF
jgi:hypothetical protein